MVRNWLLTAALLAAAGCGGAQTELETNAPVISSASIEPATEPIPDAAPDPSLPLSAEQQAVANADINLAALAAYRTYAEEFRSRNGKFPSTKRSFRSAIGAFEEAEQELAGEDEKIKLDLPEGTKFAQPGRIVYRSDGKDYKLIAQRTGDCSVVRAKDPGLIDPKRDYGPGDCIAYGYWTNGAEDW